MKLFIPLDDNLNQLHISMLQDTVSIDICLLEARIRPKFFKMFWK